VFKVLKDQVLLLLLAVASCIDSEEELLKDSIPNRMGLEYTNIAAF